MATKKKSETPVEETKQEVPVIAGQPTTEGTIIVDKVVSRGLNGVATTVKKTLKPVMHFEAMQGVWKKTWIEE